MENYPNSSAGMINIKSFFDKLKIDKIETVSSSLVDTQKQKQKDDNVEINDDDIPNLFKSITDKNWHQHLMCVYPKLKDLIAFVESEYDTQIIYPPKDKLFSSLISCSYNDVKVVIIGQDPYHQPNEANGLAFSVNKGIKVPPSLRNIYKMISNDPLFNSFKPPGHGDLSSWAQQGVLLINTCLTVRHSKPGSHKDRGWELFTDQVIRSIAQKTSPIAFVLWGQHARNKKKIILEQNPNQHLILESVHPSPLSANESFFQSQQFSRINRFLKDTEQTPIDWQSL